MSSKQSASPSSSVTKGTNKDERINNKIDMDPKTLAIGCPICGEVRHVAMSVLTAIIEIDKGHYKCGVCGCKMHVRWDALKEITVSVKYSDYVKLKSIQL